MTITKSPTNPHRSAELLARARDLCEPILRKEIDRLGEPLRRMAGYHFGWWDTAGTECRADRGKSLRSALGLCVADACGGTPAATVHIGAALELLHNFSVVHDDLMDADTVRHGRETVWCVWGESSAILVGGALHALANRILATSLPAPMAVSAVGRLATATSEMCRGQYEDCAFETCRQVDVDEYLQMAMGKTGALMGCACALGALGAGADHETVTALDGFGRQLGLAFQMVDDLIGIWGDPQVSGKPAGNDLARRKRTMPVVAALSSGTDAAVELAELYLSDVPLTTADTARARTLIETTGGRDSTQRYADEKLAAALAKLPLQLATPDLMSLAGLVTHRDR